ncbi:MAG: TonB-dependent receptor [Proteobacteria bacterium]|nr:TonB-dependent receptor [Pseudomonadota bacterium]
MRYILLSFLVLLVLAFAWQYPAYAQDSARDSTQDSASEAEDDDEIVEVEIDEVVVEGTMMEDTVQDIPKNVSVVTDLDIEQTPGKKVVDVLSRKASINVRSYTGQDKQSNIDIRGMGVTSASNVLIVVDGIRLNASDISGSDFSSIPLDQIEKIEIIRGAGSVVYGDGAVGGVVNVVTKKGEREPAADARVSLGSYETLDSTVSYRGKAGGFSFNLNAAYHDTDGYRDNGFLTKKTAGAQLGYDLTQNITVSLISSGHLDEYGLPGPVDKQDMNSRDKRFRTDSPDDSGETDDQRFIAGLKIDLGDGDSLKSHRGYRFRKNAFVIGYNPQKDRTDQTNRIDEDSKTFNLIYTGKFGTSKSKHVFKCGMDHFYSNYVRESLSLQERKNSLVESMGAFVMNQWFLLDDLKMNLGYRYNDYRGLFRTDAQKDYGAEKRWDNGDPFERKWNNNSYDMGFVYSLNKADNLFVNYATSFRTPNVDELALADDGLSPQKGNHFELGLHHLEEGSTEFSVTLFQIMIEDEIYFGKTPPDGQSVNRNYEEMTRRRGLEGELKMYPTETLYLWGNATYMEAVFEKKETRLPLIPEVKASFGLEYSIGDRMILAFSAILVGDSFDGSDEDNDEYDKLAAYRVFDGKFTFDLFNGRKLYAGINNIFDEMYSTIAYSESYYPMPLRNFYCGLDWKF